MRSVEFCENDGQYQEDSDESDGEPCQEVSCFCAEQAACASSSEDSSEAGTPAFLDEHYEDEHYGTDDK